MSAIIVHEDVYPLFEPGSEDDALRDGVWHARPIDMWVDVMIDCVPATSRWPWRHWFCEVHARRSAFPDQQGDPIWTHYYQHDFYVSSLRRAFWKADKAAVKLWDLLQDPSERPDG